MNNNFEFRRYETAMVFQHYGLLPHRNVIENVAFGLKLRGYLNGRGTNGLVQPSPGWVWKVGKIIILPSYQRNASKSRYCPGPGPETDLLLMDEPFSGLDPLIRREMQDTLIRLQKEVNKTIVFVTHDLGEAIRLGDRMAVMRQGQFVQQGTPEEIMNNPADEYVERFVADERALLSGKGRQPVYFPSKSRLTKKAKSTSPSAPLAAAGAEVK